MLSIRVYGPGCAKCRETEQRIRDVVERLGADATVEKATDFADMAQAGILTTPAVVINGVIKIVGRVPSESEVKNWLAEME